MTQAKRASSPKRTPAHTRLLRRAAAVLATAILVWVGLLLRREVRTSPRFEVAQVRMYGGQRKLIHPDEVRELAAVPVGVNIFAVDLRKVAERVASHPWAASVRVRRRLPHALEVHVTEHEPYALVQRGGTAELEFVDRAGGYIKMYEPGDPADFAVITLHPPRDGADPQVTEEGLLDALAAMGRWQATELAELSEVVVTSAGRLQLRTVDGLIVHAEPPLGRRSLERLQRLESDPRLKGVGEVFLEGTRRPDQIVVAVQGGTDA